MQIVVRAFNIHFTGINHSLIIILTKIIYIFEIHLSFNKAVSIKQIKIEDEGGIYTQRILVATGKT